MRQAARLSIASATVVASLMCGFAQAQNLSGVSSTGSCTFTVEIAPVAAALAAGKLGAAGLWTIEDSHGGLMIKLPENVADAADQTASIFNGVDTVFSASIEDNAFIQLTPGISGDFNGLRRQDLSFRRTAAATQGTNPAAVTMLITGV